MKIFGIFLVGIPLFCFSETLHQNTTKTRFIDDQSVTSWNHIINKQTVYMGLKKSADDYQLKREVNATQASPRYHITLVKKLFNWHQQHSNGIEVSLDNYALSFGQLSKLHFNIKLSAAGSNIINNLSYLGQLNPWLDNLPTYHDLLSEKANFKLTFYGENHSNTQLKTLYAAYPFQLNVDIPPHTISIDIKPTDLTYYWEQNYKAEPAAINAIKTMAIKGFIIVAETGNTKVVRNYITESFPEKYTEVFNEFEITLSDMKISYNP